MEINLVVLNVGTRASPSAPSGRRAGEGWGAAGPSRSFEMGTGDRRGWKLIQGARDAAVVGASVNRRAERSSGADGPGHDQSHVSGWGGSRAANQGADREAGGDRGRPGAQRRRGYEQMGKACVVVDAGTARHGRCCDDRASSSAGRSRRRVRMQLDALHEKTAQLPRVERFEPPHEPFGGNTHAAILNGCTTASGEW